MEPIVEVRNLSKEIGKKRIIDDVTFSLYPGEIVGFIGPNGAGKTTTIRLMTGLMEPTEGEVLIGGFEVHKQFEQALEQVGVMMENPSLYPYLSGYKNLLHYARISSGVNKEQMEEAAQWVQLEDSIREKVSTYSLGMKQRLGLAQALLHQPQALFLDEPTNGLDPEGIREFRNRIREWVDNKKTTVLISSHLLSEIEQICDRIIVLQEGKLVETHWTKKESSDQEISVFFEVDAVEKAINCIREIDEDLTVSPVENGCKVQMNRDQIPTMNRKLVEAEINVYGISVQSRSLEEQYLALTGGKSNEKNGSSDSE